MHPGRGARYGGAFCRVNAGFCSEAVPAWVDSPVGLSCADHFATIPYEKSAVGA